MNIAVNYNIGDEVTWRYAQNSNREEKCSFCGGAKEVQGADHTVLPCPKCHGKGTTLVPEYREGRSIITGITVNYDSSYNLSYNPRLESEDRDPRLEIGLERVVARQNQFASSKKFFSRKVPPGLT